ncbi:hemerythrin domain-containing protein [Carboxylicivirga sediminis]|uniref:Hemerythrin domain-containing protein n=1 Tax=Carboxylicivirga sediminis TaxID=2006564 RepID=A0A941F506_9BACT|nr:hemerythrin domain-containing protein [Carboxylicivirga sediminis]MBR8536048.1 hemerythrin domain-containing protein [Carboxylicivirga sediminis]
MKNITQILSDEHQTILKVIDAVLKECTELESGKTLNIDFFKKTIDFIKNYADKFHHAKEEDILFKAMLENIENLHCNPIPVMLHEHDEGREFVKGMEQGILENNTEKIIENARGYGALLQNHIYKEDNVLYPMAEEALTDDQKDAVNKRYMEIEIELKETMNIETLKFV